VVGKEGFEVARWLATLGFHAFVLVHRFPSAAWAVDPLCGAQAPMDDAVEAMRQIRARAPKLGIDPRSVGVVGLSSGGHLAACLVSNYPQSWVAPVSAFAEHGAARLFDRRLRSDLHQCDRADHRREQARSPAAEKQALYDAMQPDAQLMNEPPPAFLSMPRTIRSCR